MNDCLAHSIRLALLAGLTLLSSGGAWAQQTDASPAAPGTLSRPVFDTMTPVYDVAGKLERGASVVVAEVDGRAITLGNISDAIRDLPPSQAALPFDAVYPGIVERLIREQALVIRAQRNGLDDDATVRRRIKAATDHTLANELLHRAIAPNITEAMLLDRYNRDIVGKPGPEQVHGRAIMVATEKEGRDLIKELQAGADFATVARRASKDTTAATGGDLQFMQLEDLTPEIGAVLFALQPGQMTAYPVRSGAAWFILKTEERRALPAPTFSASRERIRQVLLREGVAAVVREALSGVVAREYSIVGKDLQNDGSAEK